MNSLPQNTIDAVVARAEADLGRLDPAERALIEAVLDDRASPPGTRVPARIIRWLLCDPTLIGPNRQTVLNLTNLVVQEQVDLYEARLQRPVCLINCEFLGGINAYGLRVDRFTVRGGRYGAIRMCRAKIGGELSFVARAELTGMLDLRGAQLDALLCFGARLSEDTNTDGKRAPEHLAIDGRNMNVGLIKVEGCTAIGEITFESATIHGDVILNDTVLLPGGDPSHGRALNLNGLKVEGRASLMGLRATGCVSMVNSTVRLSLNVSGAAISAAGAIALLLSQSEISGNANLSQLKACGALKLDDVHIDGTLNLFECAVEGELNLERARVGVLDDDREHWPKPGYLLIGGLKYAALGTNASKEKANRLDWLRLQKGFAPQSYEALGAVYRHMGDESLERDVAVAKQIALRPRFRVNPLGWMLNKFLQISVNYGYQPRGAILALLALLAVGGFVFQKAKSDGVIIEKPHSPTNKPQQDVAFYPWVYSFELLIPKPALGSADEWVMTEAKEPLTPYYFAYRWFHSIVGAVLAVLIALSPTRLLQKD